MTDSEKFAITVIMLLVGTNWISAVLAFKNNDTARIAKAIFLQLQALLFLLIAMYIGFIAMMKS